MAYLCAAWIASLRLTLVKRFMAHVHPWFGNVSVQAGPQWTWDFFNKNDVVLAQNLSKCQTSIAEVGWPTVGAGAFW